MTGKNDSLPSPAAVSELYASLAEGRSDVTVSLTRVDLSGHPFIRVEVSAGDDSSTNVLFFHAGQSPRLPPEVRQWALSQHTEEEIVAALREVREKGGPELGELIHELEQGTDA
jgi:hypothetical protein